jgi:hypothetical protein
MEDNLLGTEKAEGSIPSRGSGKGAGSAGSLPGGFESHRPFLPCLFSLMEKQTFRNGQIRVRFPVEARNIPTNKGITMDTGNSWSLVGYNIQYFAGEESLRKLLKNVNKWLKENDVYVDSFSTNFDIEIGWSAEVTYYGASV